MENQSEALSETADETADAIPGVGDLSLGVEKSFPVDEGPVAAIPRWLRLITLHTCSVESLANTTTRSKLEKLDVKILQSSLLQADTDMEPLAACLKRFIPATDDQDSLLKEVERLAKSGAVERFSGTWHCEAVLLSLYLCHARTQTMIVSQ